MSLTLEGSIGELEAVYAGAYTDRETNQIVDYKNIEINIEGIKVNNAKKVIYFLLDFAPSTLISFSIEFLIVYPVLGFVHPPAVPISKIFLVLLRSNRKQVMGIFPCSSSIPLYPPVGICLIKAVISSTYSCRSNKTSEKRVYSKRALFGDKGSIYMNLVFPF